MVVEAAVRTGVEAIFNTLVDLVEVAVVQRVRSTGAVSAGQPSVSSGYNPRAGFTRGARNVVNQGSRTTTRAEDPDVFSTLADIDPFPTAASPNPLPNTPEGTVRFAVRALALTPKVSLVDAIKGGRQAELEALFRIVELPMLDGERFLPEGKDMIRLNSNVYTIMSSEADPTRNILTAKLTSTHESGDFTNA